MLNELFVEGNRPIEDVVNGLVFNGSEVLHLPPEILPANRALQLCRKA